MSSANQTTTPLQLKDNCFYEPSENDKDRVVSTEIRPLLECYAGKSLNEWAKLKVFVFPEIRSGQKEKDDEADNLEFFTLASKESRTWINTSNCMGVVKLRDKKTGANVQIEIGSRFDTENKQFFLTYLLSKVFGGSMVEDVDLGPDSIWDMLLAFIFRRRLLEASAVGLFKQYQTFHHNDARIRGRIDVNEHLRRNIPFCGNVAYSTHEITFNNPTNHLIRHALAKSNRKWGRLLTSDGLMEVRHDLEQNTPTWQPGDVVNCIRRKENRFPIKHPYFHTVYEPLRQISLSILRDEGASLYQQEQEAEGVIFDGAWLWEEYLWTLLKPLGFEHPENKMDEGAWKPLAGVKLFPDFFHRQARAILDAKYKHDGNRQDDARQVFCYMFLLNAAHGGLIKPSEVLGKPEPIRRVVKSEYSPIWRDFCVTPSKQKKPEVFLNEMRVQEAAFQRNVCESLNVKPL